MADCPRRPDHAVTWNQVRDGIAADSRSDRARCSWLPDRLCNTSVSGDAAERYFQKSLPDFYLERSTFQVKPDPREITPVILEYSQGIGLEHVAFLNERGFRKSVTRSPQSNLFVIRE